MGKINAAEKITNEKFLNLYKLYAENKHNKPLEYLIASRAKEVDDLKAINHNEKSDAVAIFAITEGARIILIRQYRYAIGDYIYELPAGLVDPGESIYEAAKRELKEETGLSLHIYESELSGPFYSSAGMTDECCSIVFGKASGEINYKNMEESEEIEVVYADTDEIKRILREEKVCMKTALLLISLVLFFDD